MRATSRRTLTPVEREAETRESTEQKGGLNTKIHLAVDARGVPVRCVVTDGVTADCAKAGELVENTGARELIADRAYDCDKIVKNAKSLGMKVVIPPRKNRKVQRKYNKKAYKNRRLVENAFLHLKRDIAKIYFLLLFRSDVWLYGELFRDDRV